MPCPDYSEEKDKLQDSIKQHCLCNCKHNTEYFLQKYDTVLFLKLQKCEDKNSLESQESYKKRSQSLT